MRSRTVTITPKKAAEMLEHNGHNRPLTRTRVREFAEAMKRGDWQLTHQGIAFDTDGQLKDGQHRLAAIVEADQPVTMMVTTDLPPETFDVLDTGKRRTAADALTINGEKSTSMLAAMVRVIWLAEHLPSAVDRHQRHRHQSPDRPDPATAPQTARVRADRRTRRQRG